MFNRYSNLAITNCTFSGNSSEFGSGGVMNNGYSELIITNCSFSGNSAVNGGAMGNGASNLVITNCTFTGNSAVGTGATYMGGGAINNSGSNLAITNCTFNGNAAFTGGAMHNGDSSSTVTNCTFSDNSASEDGGAMYNYRSSDPVLTNCILWGNGPQEIFNDDDSNAIITYSDVQGGWEGVGNIDIDPLFVDPCNGDYHLFEDSPCIDAGDPNYAAGPNETDLDGNPRVVNGRVDMGAYELQPLTPAELLLDLTDYLDELSLHKGIAGSLQSKLEAALQLLEDGNENNDGAAAGLLEAFINAAWAQYDKKIPEADADALIAAAQEIIWLLGGE
jgi:predicted outer membrane repeat protein